jgi:hypothetical protein
MPYTANEILKARGKIDNPVGERLPLGLSECYTREVDVIVEKLPDGRFVLERHVESVLGHDTPAKINGRRTISPDNDTIVFR